MTTTAFPAISKSTSLANGTTYAYVDIKPKGQKPCILFLHGFPSSSYDWRHQISFFADLGYGILAPDLLGYGGTDKPADVEAYRLKKMCEDVVSILDTEGIDQVVGVAHDWGSVLLSRLANYFPERFLAFCFLSVGYTPPQADFNVDTINDMLETKLGYPAYAYWDFFINSDAAELINRDIERTISLFYPGSEKPVKDIMCVKGATRAWFIAVNSASLDPSFLSKEEKTTHQEIFDSQNGGYGPGLNWYKAQAANLHASDESGIPPERIHIQQRTLAILASRDSIGVPALQEATMRPWIPNLRIATMDAGHWVQLLKPNELNELLKGFIENDKKSNL